MKCKPTVADIQAHEELLAKYTIRPDKPRKSIAKRIGELIDDEFELMEKAGCEIMDGTETPATQEQYNHQIQQIREAQSALGYVPDEERYHVFDDGSIIDLLHRAETTIVEIARYIKLVEVRHKQ
jgi:hypothetical protein